MVNKVKNFENGFIIEPVVFNPDQTLSELDKIRTRKRISGVPVTVDGTMGSKLIGLVSNRDTDFVKDRTKCVKEFMTPIDKLITGTYPINIAEANQILKVPVPRILMSEVSLSFVCTYHRRVRKDIFLSLIQRVIFVP
jgi:IMP dehydrogenase